MHAAVDSRFLVATAVWDIATCRPVSQPKAATDLSDTPIRGIQDLSGACKCPAEVTRFALHAMSRVSQHAGLQLSGTWAGKL